MRNLCHAGDSTLPNGLAGLPPGLLLDVALLEPPIAGVLPLNLKGSGRLEGGGGSCATGLLPPMQQFPAGSSDFQGLDIVAHLQLAGPVVATTQPEPTQASHSPGTSSCTGQPGGSQTPCQPCATSPRGVGPGAAGLPLSAPTSGESRLGTPSPNDVHIRFLPSSASHLTLEGAHTCICVWPENFFFSIFAD